MFVSVFGSDAFLEDIGIDVVEGDYIIRKPDLSCQPSQHVQRLLYRTHISEYLINDIRFGVLIVIGPGYRLQAGGWRVFLWYLESLSSMNTLKHNSGLGIWRLLSVGQRSLGLA